MQAWLAEAVQEDRLGPFLQTPQITCFETELSILWECLPHTWHVSSGHPWEAVGWLLGAPVPSSCGT